MSFISPIRGLRAGIVALVAAAVVLGGAGSAAGAPADPEITWSVQPSTPKGPDGRDTMAYTLAPGESTTDYVAVSNLGGKPLTVAVKSLDATMTEDGAFTLPPTEQQPTAAGSWIGMNGDGVYTIKPKTRVDIPVRVSVPKGAAPGEHPAGIIASVTTAPGGDDDAPQFAVDRRVGVRVYITVPGDVRPSATVTDVAVSHSAGLGLTAPATVTYTVKNTGNVRIEGTAALQVAGPFGMFGVTAKPTTIPEILPGASIKLTRTLDGVATSGLVTASVQVSVKPIGAEGHRVDGQLQASGSTVSVPWLLVVVLVLIAIVVFLLVRRARRLRARLAEADRRAAAAEAALVDAAASTDDELVSSAGPSAASTSPTT